jgi:hypothetical protein
MAQHVLAAAKLARPGRISGYLAGLIALVVAFAVLAGVGRPLVGGPCDHRHALFAVRRQSTPPRVERNG